MGRTPHILVIGAGLVGLSSADALRARGAKVTIIDANDGPALGASFSNSGMIHPSQSTPWLRGDFDAAARAVLCLARRSKTLLLPRLKSLGLAGAMRAPGCLQLFSNEGSGQKAADRYRALGIEVSVAPKGPATFGRFGLLFPGDRSANAYEYCRALEKDLRVRGAQIIYGIKDIPEAGQVFDHVVIAAGTGSAAAARGYGFDLPVKPVRGHALNFALPGAQLPQTPIMDFDSHSALTVFEDHLRLSGTVGEEAPERLIDIWRDIAPELVATLGNVTSRWSQDRPMSALGRPFITQLKPGLWVNSGHGHMGWTLSAGSGELIAQMILEGRKDSRFNLPS